MSLSEVFQSFVGNLQKSASVKTVFGDPIAAEGRTIIPVARVGYGWGTGMGSVPGDPTNEQEPSGEKAMGFGGGIGAQAVGVLEVSSEGTRFVPIGIGRKLLGAMAAGLIVGLVLGRRR